MKGLSGGHSISIKEKTVHFTTAQTQLLQELSDRQWAGGQRRTAKGLRTKEM